MTEEQWLELFLDHADRDTEKALKLMAKFIVKITQPQKGFERGGLDCE